MTATLQPPAHTGPAAPPAAPPAPTARAAPRDNRSPRSTLPTPFALNTTQGKTNGPSRSVIYGPGGVGKSTLASWLPAPLILDVESSTHYLNVLRTVPKSWAELRGMLATIEANPPAGVQSIVIDSGTVAEVYANEHVIENRKTEAGEWAASIEDYGWGKGFQYGADEFGAILSDLDRIVAKGLNVCIVAHDITTPVPNPLGEDFLRWEPFFYAGDRKGKGSIRERVIAWCDHLLFVRFDVHVKKGSGKGVGSGTRTVTTQELPTHRAKSRAVQVEMPYDPQDPSAIWRTLGVISAPRA